MKHRGLPRPVGAGETDTLIGENTQGHIIQKHAFVKILGDIR